MSTVVNHTSWSVPTIDYDTYHRLRRRYSNNTAEWKNVQLSKHLGVKDSKTGPFHCGNTKFTMNTSLHGTVETEVSCQDHIGLKKNHPVKTYTYRDIATTLEQYQAEYQLWIFDFIYPHALFDLPSIPRNLFQLVYTDPFVQAVRQLHTEIFQNRPYASIHIRGGDAGFRKQNWTAVFPVMMNATKTQILEYHHQHQHLDDASTKVDGISTYGLLVVTDIKGVRMRDMQDSVFQLWRAHELEMVQSLWDEHQINMEVASGSNYSESILSTLKNATWSFEAGVYLDQLMAVCANISFVASLERSSTFQQRIRQTREQSLRPC